MPREYDGDTDCVQPQCDVNFKCKLIGFDFRSDMFVVKSASLIVNAIILQLNFLISWLFWKHEYTLPRQWLITYKTWNLETS